MKPLSSRQARAHAIPPGVKRIVNARDGGICVYCGMPGLPEAHFIPRSRGGLGVPENILTLCRDCHKKFDHGGRYEREGMREFFADYLKNIYPDWDEEKLIYRRYT